MTMLQNENNNRKVFTENGATAYATSGKFILDFNFKLSQYRNMSVADIQSDFCKVFFEDPLIATKFIFYIGDVRGGLGERKVFRACIDWLANNRPEVAIAIMKYIPEYTRWDNLVRLIPNSNVGKVALRIIKTQLRDDMIDMKRNNSVSLCAKWMPSINASSKETIRLANIICNKLNTTPRQVPQFLTTTAQETDEWCTRMR